MANYSDLASKDTVVLWGVARDTGVERTTRADAGKELVARYVQSGSVELLYDMIKEGGTAWLPETIALARESMDAAAAKSIENGKRNKVSSNFLSIKKMRDLLSPQIVERAERELKSLFEDRARTKEAMGTARQPGVAGGRFELPKSIGNGFPKGFGSGLGKNIDGPNGGAKPLEPKNPAPRAAGSISTDIDLNRTIAEKNIGLLRYFAKDDRKDYQERVRAGNEFVQICVERGMYENLHDMAGAGGSAWPAEVRETAKQKARKAALGVVDKCKREKSLTGLLSLAKNRNVPQDVRESAEKLYAELSKAIGEEASKRLMGAPGGEKLDPKEALKKAQDATDRAKRLRILIESGTGAAEPQKKASAK